MRQLGKLLFWLLGWQIGGSIPTLDKCVIILTPHTSNWDFFIGLLGRSYINKPVKFLAKHQLFIFPFSFLMRYLGGIPVNRTKHNNLVSFSVKLFSQVDSLYLTIAPEGTRKQVSRWKLGFYYIAKKANVPIVIMSLDYQKKTVSFSEPINPSNDIKDDFNTIISIASQCEGKHKQSLPPFPNSQ